MKHIIEHPRFYSFEEVNKLFTEYEDELNRYIGELLWWNKRVNLVSRDVSRETIREHVIHSLMIYTSDLYKESKYVIDAGSGGGLPGIPLSIVDSKKEVVLNDIVSKKMMACKQIVLKLGLNNCSTETKSIENIKLTEGGIIISKHAFKLNDLVSLLTGKPWNGIILLKGLQEVEEELGGIEESLNINVFSLEQEFNSFYDGKALVEIIR